MTRQPSLCGGLDGMIEDAGIGWIARTVRDCTGSTKRDVGRASERWWQIVEDRRWTGLFSGSAGVEAGDHSERLGELGCAINARSMSCRRAGLKKRWEAHRAHAGRSSTPITPCATGGGLLRPAPVPAVRSASFALCGSRKGAGAVAPWRRSSHARSTRPAVGRELKAGSANSPRSLIAARLAPLLAQFLQRVFELQCRRGFWNNKLPRRTGEGDPGEGPERRRSRI